MSDIKQKSIMIKQKIKSTNHTVVKEAGIILKKHYLDEQDKCNPQQELAPNVYATERMENSAGKAASLLLTNTSQSAKSAVQKGYEIKTTMEYQNPDSLSESLITTENFTVHNITVDNMDALTTYHPCQIRRFQEQTARRVYSRNNKLTQTAQTKYCAVYREKNIYRDSDNSFSKSNSIFGDNPEKKNVRLISPIENKLLPVQSLDKLKMNSNMIKSDFVRIQSQAFFYGKIPVPVNSVAKRKVFAQRRMKQRLYANVRNPATQKKFTLWRSTKEFIFHAGRAVMKTANTFLAVGSGLILLVSIMFLALLSSLAASPFGILLSNEAAEAGTMPLSAAVAAVQNEFTEKLELLQSADNYAEIYINGEPADFSEVVAVFAVHTTGNVEAISADVISIDDEKLERLKNVFWDMTTISARVDTRVIMIDEETSYIEKDLYIQITSKDALEQSSSYHFSKRQMDALYELLSQKILLSGLIQNASFVSSDIKAVMQSLPENLELDRKSVVEKALSLVGKVNYFWGGKSLTLGWDDNWGVLRKVTAEGSPTTGTYRLYGLDCSGFIDWAFFNASSGEYVISKGGGVAAQRANCIEISLENAQVGDLVFYEDNSHAGIICGRDDNGGLLIVHCTSGNTNTVVITNSTGFAIAGRPQYYIN